MKYVCVSKWNIFNVLLFKQCVTNFGKLIDIDQSLNTWRYKHALLAQRMIGIKIGSGGSSGYNYLRNNKLKCYDEVTQKMLSVTTVISRTKNIN